MWLWTVVQRAPGRGRCTYSPCRRLETEAEGGRPLVRDEGSTRGSCQRVFGTEAIGHKALMTGEEKGPRTVSGLKETRELKGWPVKGGLVGEKQLGARDVGSTRECGQRDNSRGSDTRNRDPVASGDLTGGQQLGEAGGPSWGLWGVRGVPCAPGCPVRTGKAERWRGCLCPRGTSWEGCLRSRNGDTNLIDGARRRPLLDGLWSGGRGRGLLLGSGLLLQQKDKQPSEHCRVPLDH